MLPVGLQIVVKKSGNDPESAANDLEKLFIISHKIEAHFDGELQIYRPGFMGLRYKAGKCCSNEK